MPSQPAETATSEGIVWNVMWLKPHLHGNYDKDFGDEEVKTHLCNAMTSAADITLASLIFVRFKKKIQQAINHDLHSKMYSVL